MCQEIYQLLYLCNLRCLTMSFRTDSSRASWSMKFRSSQDIMNLKHGILTTELLFFANKFISPPFSRSTLNCLSSSGKYVLFLFGKLYLQMKVGQHCLHNQVCYSKIRMFHSIRITCPCNVYTPLSYSKTGVYRGIHVFLFLLKIIDCGYSLEPPH